MASAGNVKQPVYVVRSAVQGKCRALFGCATHAGNTQQLHLRKSVIVVSFDEITHSKIWNRPYCPEYGSS